jgi:hypothetical protein
VQQSFLLLSPSTHSLHVSAFLFNFWWAADCLSSSDLCCN